MSAATQNGMDRLRAERDSAVDQVAYWRERAVASEGREQALAAHVERLHMAWVDAKRCVSVVAFPALYRVEQYQHLAKRSIEKLESVVSDTPTTSLTRLKAEWQASLLEEYREDLGSAGVGFVDCLAAQLRRQSKEGE